MAPDDPPNIVSLPRALVRPPVFPQDPMGERCPVAYPDDVSIRRQGTLTPDRAVLDPEHATDETVAYRLPFERLPTESGAGAWIRIDGAWILEEVLVMDRLGFVGNFEAPRGLATLDIDLEPCDLDAWLPGGAHAPGAPT